MRKTNIFIMLIPVLLSCETGKVNIKPSPSQSVSVTSSVNSPSLSPSNTVTPVNSVSPSPSPVNSSSENIPDECVIDNNEKIKYFFREYLSVNGIVMDSDLKPLKDVDIQLIPFENSIKKDKFSKEELISFYSSVLNLDKLKCNSYNFLLKTQTDITGKYYLYFPYGEVIIKASKKGFSTRERLEIVKSGFSDPNLNTFNFGGMEPYSSRIPLQDEPEISEIKINAIRAKNTGKVSGFRPSPDDQPSFINVPANLEIEMTFSEPVIPESVFDNFRIVSQNFNIRNNTNFIIDKNTKGITFTKNSDDTVFIFKTNKPVLQEISGTEARYRIEFLKPFKDKTNKEGFISGISTQRLIRYSPSIAENFLVFSVLNGESTIESIGYPDNK